MYCRRADVTRTFMVSYSYCQGSVSCVEDEWDYIDLPCSTGWMRGYQIALIVDCDPSLSTCQSFVSSPQQAGQWTNYTETLALGQYCTVEVDATSFVGRVVFDNALTLGV